MKINQYLSLVCCALLPLATFAQNQPPAAPPIPKPLTDAYVLKNIQDNKLPLTNFVDMESALIKTYGINFSWTADEVASLQKQGATTNDIDTMKLLLPSADSKGDVVSVFLFTGARLQNPYSIDLNTNGTGTLKGANSKTDGFIELDVYCRYIFRTGAREDDFLRKNPGEHWHWLFEATDARYMAPDVDLRLGYSFSGSSSPSNVTASTITQGSDFYLDGSFGQPLVRCSWDGFKAQATLEGAAGFTTDKNFLQIHPDLFAGGGVQAAVLAGTNSIGNLYFIMRGGIARVDEPALMNGTSTIPLDGLQRPVFVSKWAPSAGSVLLWKFTQSFAIQMAGNAYFNDVPSWNISFGVSVDPWKFFNVPTGK